MLPYYTTTINSVKRALVMNLLFRRSAAAVRVFQWYDSVNSKKLVVWLRNFLKRKKNHSLLWFNAYVPIIIR